MRRARRWTSLIVALVLLLSSVSAYAAEATPNDEAAIASDAADSGGYVRIKNKWQNNYLYEDSDGIVRYGFPGITDPHAQWSIEDAPGDAANAYRIKNRATGHYITIEDVGARREPLTSKAIATSTVDDQWIIENAVNRPGYKTIRSAKHPDANYYIHEEDQLGFAEVSMDIGAEWESPQWMLEPATDIAPVRIYNKFRGSYLYEVTADGDDKGKVAYGDMPMNDPASHWFVDVVSTESDGSQVVQLRNRATGNLITQGILWDKINALAPSDSTKSHWIMADASSEGFVTFQNVYAIEGGEAEMGPGTFVLNTQFDDIYARSNDWSDLGKDNAHWRLEIASDVLPTRLASYGDISDESSKLYLYEESGIVKYGPLAANDLNYLWLFEDYDGKKIIRNVGTGHLMTNANVDAAADPLESADVDPAEATSQWVTHESDLYDDFVAIQSAANGEQYINLAGHTGSAQAGVVDPTINEAQWFMERPGASGDGEAQYVLIQNVWNSLYMYEDADGELKYGNVKADDHRGHWLVEKYNGRKRIQNRATGHYLNIFDQPNGHIQVTDVDFSAADQDSLLPALWRVKANGNIWNAQDLNKTPGQTKYLNIENLSKYVEYNAINPNYSSARWQFVPAPEEAVAYKRIKNKRTGGYLFEQDGKVAYGDPADTDPASHWMVTETASGKITIQNRESSKYISIEGAEFRNPQDPAKVLDGPVFDSYTWVVTADVYGYSSLRSGWTNEHYLTAYDDLGYLQSTSHQEVPDIATHDASLFTFEDAPAMSQYIRILSKSTGQYLYEDDKNVMYGDVDITDSRSQWFLEDAGEGKQYIRNRATGNYINIEFMDRENPMEAVSSEFFDMSWGSASPKWFIEDAPASGYVTIRSGWEDWKRLSTKDALGFAQIVPHADVEADGTQFKFEGVPSGQLLVPSGPIRIKSANDGTYLYENYSGVVVNGSIEANNAYSHWSIESEGGIQRIKNRATGHYMAMTGDYAYIESTTVTGDTYSASQWVLEGAPVGDNYLIRSNNGKYDDEYVNVQNHLGYPERGLYPIANNSLHWTFEPAPAEAVTPDAPNPTQTETATNVINDSNYIRIENKATGAYLVEQSGNVAFRAAVGDDPQAQWLLQDYNGHKLIQNRASGRWLTVAADGEDVMVGASKALAAQWSIDEVLGYYQITSELSEGRYLQQDGSAAHLQAGAAVSENANWSFEEVPGDVAYEAEKAFVGGGVKAERGYIDNFSATGAQAIIAVKAPSEGMYDVTIRYANREAEVRTLSLLVNGLKQEAVEFPTGGRIGNWNEATVNVPLRSGYNTIALERTATDTGAVAIDAIVVHDSTALAYRGADLPYVTYEAEHMQTNGTLIGPSRAYLDPAAEASGRQAVKLDATGEYVEFATAKDANSILVRYSIPDAPGGGGQEATIALYVNGEFRTNLNLTSEYAWVYGNYPWSNDPKQGNGHRYYDDVHALIGDVPAGSTIRLQKDAGNVAEHYIIDLVDMEQAPEAPYEMPEGFVSITEFGATANDETDDAQALRDAIEAARAEGQGVWVPAGTFNMHDGLIILDDITIRGAGMWHTTLRGAKFFGNGDNIRIFDFLLDGELSVRDDEAQTNGFEGAFGPGSTIQHVWIEHTKTGMWLTRPINKNGYEFDLTAYTDGLYVGGGRIRNVMADGMNFAVNTKNSMAEHMNVRYTGDDALAMWSFVEYVPTDFTENNTYRFNTVHLPWLANNIIVFGGKNHKIQDNIVMDNLTHGSGISVSTKFTPTAYEGTILVERNTLIRAGARDPGLSMNVGAIWVYAFDRDIDTEVIIRDNVALDSTYHGLSVQGGKTLGSFSESKAKVTVQNTVIDGAGLTGVEIAPTVNGAINLDNVIIRGAKLGDISNKNGNFKVHVFNTLADTPVGPNPGPGAPPAGSGPIAGGIGNAEQNGQKLLDAANAEQDRIVFRSEADAGSANVELPVEALKAAAEANGSAVIEIRHGNVGYELPINILEIIASHNDVPFDLNEGTLSIAIQPPASEVAERIEQQAAHAGMKLLGAPVDFKLELKHGEETLEISDFGNTYINRTFTLDQAADARSATVLAFDPDTDAFRFIPAVFETENGNTVVRAKSASNSIYVVAEHAASFHDITAHWARADIELLASKLIVSGKSEQSFAPKDAVTRAEFAALLVRALGLRAEGDAVAYGDVRAADWFAGSVSAASRIGLVHGFEDGSFRPNETITREQMAAMIDRAVAFASEQEASADLDRFADAADIGAWAEASVSRVVGLGIMTGNPNGHFAAKATATRAEAVVALKQLLAKLEFINE